MSPDTDKSRIARLEARADGLDRRQDSTERDVKAFAAETGVRIKIETELDGRVKTLEQGQRDLRSEVDEINRLSREASRWKTTTYLSVGSLVLLVGGFVIALLNLVHGG